MRVGKGDKSGIKECVSEYGNFIWALAKKMTRSNEEAEAATEEIFKDIWRYAKHAEDFKLDETAVISQIARWRLVRYLQPALKEKSEAAHH